MSVKCPAGLLTSVPDGHTPSEPAASGTPASPEPEGSSIRTAATPRAYLSFGRGVRYCIGAPLARIELQAIFSQLVRRFPTLQMAVPVEELKINDGQLTGGLLELPVTW